MRNFLVHLFYRTPLGDCFWLFTQSCFVWSNNHQHDIWRERKSAWMDGILKKNREQALPSVLKKFAEITGRYLFYKTSLDDCVLEQFHWWESSLMIATTKLLENYRSSHQRCSVKEVVLRNFAIFTEKNLWRSVSLANQWIGHYMISTSNFAILLKRDFIASVSLRTL